MTRFTAVIVAISILSSGIALHNQKSSESQPKGTETDKASYTYSEQKDCEEPDTAGEGDEEAYLLSEDCLALRKYAAEMVKLHPFYNQLNSSEVLETVYKIIPTDLDLKASVESYGKINIAVAVGLYPCPYCAGKNTKVEIHRTDDNGECVFTPTSYNNNQSRWYSDNGDKSIFSCSDCKKSFDITSYCMNCDSFDCVDIICIDDYIDNTVKIGNHSIAEDGELIARTYGLCSNCNSFICYQNCCHNCGDECRYDHFERQEIEAIVVERMRNKFKLDILKRIFNCDGFYRERF